MSFRPLVLCYHAVSASWEHPLAVGAETLERQLRLLLRWGFTPVDADAVLANRPHTFHVTFDDAYRTAADAIPLLERLRLPATVYVCSGYARDGRMLDVPELERSRELLTMSWDALRELAERGVEIGSHTVTHPHLCEVTDAELHRELADSRAEIEAELGRPCRYLAYPYGEGDARVQSAARWAGYAAAYTLRGRTSVHHLFALPRVDVYRRDGMPRFTAKVSPAGRPALAALTAARRARQRTMMKLL